MNVTSFHIQHVVKAYGQRIGRKGLVRTGSSSRHSRPAPDIISISSEAKRRQVMDQITHDIVSRAKGHEAEKNINEGLLEDMGAKTENSRLIAEKEEAPDFRFRVVSEKEGNGETIKELSIDDLKKMVENLYSGETNSGE